jgi:phosphoserine phosphatase
MPLRLTTWGFLLEGTMNEHRAIENLILQDGGQDVITSTQVLNDEFYDDLQDMKDNFKFRLDGYTPVASIPETIVNHWIREGFDFYSAPANEILAKLRSENFDVFIVSGDTRFDH